VPILLAVRSIMSPSAELLGLVPAIALVGSLIAGLLVARSRRRHT
jgi:hypothetical protein